MGDEDRIRDMVRKVVYRTVSALEATDPRGTTDGGRLVTQQDIQNAPIGGKLRIPDGALVTPLARQTAIESGVKSLTPFDFLPQLEFLSPDGYPFSGAFGFRG